MADMRRQIRDDVGKMTARLGLPADGVESGKIVCDAEAIYDGLMDKKMTELEAYRQVMRELDCIEEKLREEREKKTDRCDKDVKPAPDVQSDYNGKRVRRLAGKLNAVMWLATPALYVVLSMGFGGWGKWWLLFLSSSIGSIIIDMLCDWNCGESLSRMKGHFIGILWLASVIAYFLLSFAFGWKLTWLVFVVAMIISVILGGEDKNNG